MIKEFKEFIMRGNVIDLAVAVIIGAAFTAVVNSFANDILMQIVAAVFGFSGIAGDAAWIGKILLFIFLVLFVVSLIMGRRPTTG